MNIIHRKLEVKDIEQVISFFRELEAEGAEVSFSEVEKREEIEKWLDNENIYAYIAESEEEGKVLGVFRALRGEVGREHSCFLTAAVNREYRGFRIGQSLTNYGLDELKKEGLKIARAYVYSNNPSSVSTLLKCGFTSSGSVLMHHFDEKLGRYVDDMIFHKIL